VRACLLVSKWDPRAHDPEEKVRRENGREGREVGRREERHGHLVGPAVEQEEARADRRRGERVVRRR
jgi:hypothetical protein